MSLPIASFLDLERQLAPTDNVAETAQSRLSILFFISSSPLPWIRLYPALKFLSRGQSGALYFASEWPIEDWLELGN